MTSPTVCGIYNPYNLNAIIGVLSFIREFAAVYGRKKVMGYQPIEELLPKSDWSVYKLVRLASTRALELSEGKPSLVKGIASDKLTTIALEEIAQGLVTSVESAEEIRKEMEEAKEQEEDNEKEE